MAEQNLFQSQDGGSIPTSPLQIFLKEIDNSTAKVFCFSWHYSKTCPPCKYIFGAFYNNFLIGIIAFGQPAMRNQSQCYNAVLELRRLCLIDKAPKNSESRFISVALKLLRKKGIKGNIISLADPEHGHTGMIYRAANFKYLGLERGGGSRKIIINGISYHSRTAFQRFGASGIKKLKILFQDVKIFDKKRKHVYSISI